MPPINFNIFFFSLDYSTDRPFWEHFSPLGNSFLIFFTGAMAEVFGAIHKVSQHFLGGEGSKIEKKVMTDRLKKSADMG